MKPEIMWNYNIERIFDGYIFLIALASSLNKYANRLEKQLGRDSLSDKIYQYTGGFCLILIILNFILFHFFHINLNLSIQAIAFIGFSIGDIILIIYYFILKRMTR